MSIIIMGVFLSIFDIAGVGPSIFGIPGGCWYQYAIFTVVFQMTNKYC